MTHFAIPLASANQHFPFPFLNHVSPHIFSSLSSTYQFSFIQATTPFCINCMLRFTCSTGFYANCGKPQHLKVNFKCSKIIKMKQGYYRKHNLSTYTLFIYHQHKQFKTCSTDSHTSTRFRAHQLTQMCLL